MDRQSTGQKEKRYRQSNGAELRGKERERESKIDGNMERPEWVVELHVFLFSQGWNHKSLDGVDLYQNEQLFIKFTRGETYIRFDAVYEDFKSTHNSSAVFQLHSDANRDNELNAFLDMLRIPKNDLRRARLISKIKCL